MSNYQEPHHLADQVFWDVEDARSSLLNCASALHEDRKDEAIDELKKAIFSAQQALEKLEK